MMTVQTVSQKTGISVRTLHHYDSIGLLKPTAVTTAGYRQYDEAALERLQCILLFRELQFPLREIRRIIDSPDFDRNRALEQQIHLLELRREHLEHLITVARGVQMMGVRALNLEAFDTRKIDAYCEQAKKTWSDTAAWKEYKEKSKGRSRAQEEALGEGLMNILAAFYPLREGPADAPAAQATVKRMRDYISEHLYTCTPQVLGALGKMYGGGGSFTENIDSACGAGTAAFAAQAIQTFCEREAAASSKDETV